MKIFFKSKKMFTYKPLLVIPESRYKAGRTPSKDEIVIDKEVSRVTNFTDLKITLKKNP